jgi:mono/diheme cytochrome c family protein
VVDAANEVPAAEARRPDPNVADAQSLKLGLDLYQANCQACHGPRGDGDGPTAVHGGLGMSPLSTSVPALTSGELAYRIKVGTVGSGMPGFASTLSDSDRWDIVNFLRSMTSQ